MDKHRVRRIEKELAKLQPDDGAEQRNVDQMLRDLNKIYGDGQGAEPNIESGIFLNMVDHAIRKVYGEENLVK